MPETSLPLCVRIATDDERSREALLADGWREIEILETWENGLTLREQHSCIHEACPEDFTPCLSIALEASKHDRLRHDPAVPSRVADHARGKHLESEFENSFVLVFKVVDHVKGFITCRNRRVGLFAVAPDQQGKGYGAALLAELIRRVGTVAAGTQEHNEPARRLYRHMGFTLVERQRTFHK